MRRTLCVGFMVSLCLCIVGISTLTAHANEGGRDADARDTGIQEHASCTSEAQESGALRCKTIVGEVTTVSPDVEIIEGSVRIKKPFSNASDPSDILAFSKLRHVRGDLVVHANYVDGYPVNVTFPALESVDGSIIIDEQQGVHTFPRLESVKGDLVVIGTHMQHEVYRVGAPEPRLAVTVTPEEPFASTDFQALEEVGGTLSLSNITKNVFEFRQLKRIVRALLLSDTVYTALPFMPQLDKVGSLLIYNNPYLNAPSADALKLALDVPTLIYNNAGDEMIPAMNREEDQENTSSNWSDAAAAKQLCVHGFPAMLRPRSASEPLWDVLKRGRCYHVVGFVDLAHYADAALPSFVRRITQIDGALLVGSSTLTRVDLPRLRSIGTIGTAPRHDSGYRHSMVIVQANVLRSVGPFEALTEMPAGILVEEGEGDNRPTRTLRITLNALERLNGDIGGVRERNVSTPNLLHRDIEIGALDDVRFQLEDKGILSTYVDEASVFEGIVNDYQLLQKFEQMLGE